MSEEKLVPKLRFIDESDNWNLFKLGEVLDKKGYIRGPFGSALKRGEMKKEGIPVYEQQHAIYNNRIFRYYIDNDKFQELKRFQVFPNDLIVSCSGTIGKTSLITNNDEKGIISQALLILRSNPNIINPKFLKYFLETNSGYNSLISSAGGSSQVNIAKKQIILDIPLLVPNLETQSKIISFLDLINNKIELLEEKHKYYQDFKKYLMQKLFAQELRFNFTDDWKQYKLKDVLTVKSSSISINQLEENTGNYPLYGASGFLKNIDFCEMDVDYISIVKDGSGVGNLSFHEKNSSIVNTSQYLLPKKNFNINFLYYLLQTINLMKYVNGSSIPHIYFKDYCIEKINIPSLDEQEKIGKLFVDVDITMENLNKNINATQEFKKGLLQQMFVVQLILSLLQNKKHI